MHVPRVAATTGVLVALAAWPAQAQHLEIIFLTESAIPVGGWASVAIALLLAALAHRTLRGRGRTLGTLFAVAAGAAGFAWHASEPTSANAAPPSFVANLVSSPTSVPLQPFDAAYRLTNTGVQRIVIVSIERVDAPGWTFIPSPEPFCDKQQQLPPGQFCFVALGLILPP